MTNYPITSHSPAQAKALHRQLTALRKQLTATEAQVAVLREDNNRLEAALAVERAARDPDALPKARHDLHLVTYKLLRVLKIFDHLHLQRPDVDVRPADFVNDDFLVEFGKRVEAHFARKLSWQRSPVEPGPVLTAPEIKEPAADFGDARVLSRDSDPRSVPVDDRTTQRAQSDPQSDPPAHAVSAPSKGNPVLVDASNPAAELLRLLIGASSVEVHESPPRVRIQIANEEGTRDAAFFLSCEDGIVTATKDFVKFDQPQLPHFLTETSIEFEVDQAPNFLILFMGAILDFSVEPAGKQTDVENIASPSQPRLTEDDASMEV